MIYQINGYDAYYFHLCSFLIHCFNALIVFFLSRRIFDLFGIGNGLKLPYIVALIWSIHPLNVEAVVWVSASKIVLFTFFSLLSFLYFIKAIQQNSIGNYLISTGLFFLSCCCKEQAMVTPFIFLLFVFCYKRASGQQILKWRRYLGCIAGMYCITAVFIVISWQANNLADPQFTPIVKYSGLQRIMLTFYCVNFYLTNFLMPIHLHYHYPYPVQPGETMSLSFYVYPLLLIGCLIFLYLILRRSRHRYFYLLGTGIFLLQILLVLQIIPMPRPAIMADRYMYIPSYALLLLLIAGIDNTLSTLRYRNFWIAFNMSLGVYVFFLTVYSHQLVLRWINFNLVN